MKVTFEKRHERHERVKYVGYYRKYLLLLPKDSPTDLRSPISAPLFSQNFK